MSVLIHNIQTNEFELVMKGAPEMILRFCDPHSSKTRNQS